MNRIYNSSELVILGANFLIFIAGLVLFSCNDIKHLIFFFTILLQTFFWFFHYSYSIYIDLYYKKKLKEDKNSTIGDELNLCEEYFFKFFIKFKLYILIPVLSAILTGIVYLVKN